MGALTSPVTKFPGTVVLIEPLSLDACLAYEEARQKLSAQFCPEAYKIQVRLIKAKEEDKDTEKILEELSLHFASCFESDKKPRCKPGLSGAAADKACIPALLACVKEWHIDGVPDKPTATTFPGTPRLDSHSLIEWIMSEIQTLYEGDKLDETDPNA